MKKLILLTILTAIFITGYSQENGLITLQQCYSDAAVASALNGDKQILDQLYQLKDKNLLSGWYPSLDAGATALYNSSVVDLSSALGSLPIPGLSDIGGMPHDQYKLTIDINQVLYDGGAIRGTRNAEKASNDYSRQEVEVELYKTREQVNNIFFTLVLVKKQIALLHTYRDLINERMVAVRSAIDNGVLMQSDYDILLSEKVKIDQQVTEAGIRINSLLAVLSDLTGKQFGPGSEPVLPEITEMPEATLERPELELFNLRYEILDAGKSIIESTRRPKAFGFATLGYGSPPGNDFFSDSFGTYAIVGAGVKWTITDWNRTKRNIEMVDLNKMIVESKKEDLVSALDRALELKRSEIKSLESMAESDQELIRIRKSITNSTESKLKNGVITATDYMAELNAEKQAVLNHEIHIVTLVRSKVEYLYLAGKEIE